MKMGCSSKTVILAQRLFYDSNVTARLTIAAKSSWKSAAFSLGAGNCSTYQPKLCHLGKKSRNWVFNRKQPTRDRPYRASVQ